MRLLSNALIQLNARTHRTWALPILLYSPTARCNSRCVSCDWWRSDGATDLDRGAIEALCAELPALRTKLVVFTGGEPLVRDDVFDLADLFRARGVALHLLTSGLALEKLAPQVAARFDAVTVSLDGHTPELYRAVRGVNGLGAVERGVRRLKELRPDLPVRARSTLHRKNFRALPDLIEKSAAMGLDEISFLAADVSSDAFGRGPALPKPGAALPEGPDVPRAGAALPVAGAGLASPHHLLLDEGEIGEFERVIAKALLHHRAAFARGQVAERGDRLRRLARYYRARLGQGPFPAVQCNAPWASAVVEADGTVRPCFFQPAIGNLREKGLRALLDDEMVRFRRGLDVARDETCRQCVCSLNVRWRTRLW